VALAALTASGNVTLSGGTANGVAYLNGSKVLTTGSGFNTDGTNIGIGVGATSGQRVYARTATDTGIAYLADNGVNTGFVVRFTPSTTLIGNDFNQPLVFLTNNTEQMRLTSTGLGIGTSSPTEALTITNDATYKLSLKRAADGSYAALGAVGNNFLFYNNGAERMRLDSSGNLGLGVTPSAWASGFPALQMTGGSFVGISTSIFDNPQNAYYSSTGYKYTVTSAASLFRQNAGQHQWFTAPSGTAGNAISFTQALTLTAAGDLLLGTTTQEGFLTVKCPSANQNGANIICSNTSGPNYVLNLQSNASVANTANLIRGYSNTSTGVFFVAGNGNVTNTNNSYGAISDAKLKENVTDATPKLEKLNQVRIVNFNIKGDEQKQLGVIAQELEQVFPGMVEESPDRDKEGNDLGTTTKSVKYSVFVPMLIKAMQEQQAIITALTARVAALESN
jgi:hypothetical protein